MSIKTGKIIKARLKAMGKTQGWLAESVKTPEKPDGVSINAVSKWTKTGKIARDHVQLVADLLEITTDELLAGSLAVEEAPPAETRIERLNAEEKELVDLHRISIKEGQDMIMSAARHAPKKAARSLRRPPH